MKKLIFIWGIILFASFSLAVTSQGSYCCERTNSGAWCVNEEQSACDASYNSAPTSCETTSYCKLGTCYDSSEGICMGNTPQKVCNDKGGTWDERDIDEVPQCQLGCCVISDQAAFVTLTRCKALSTFYGVENNYRTDISSEVQCIAEAQGQDMGACVYEQDFERLCKFTTRAECGASDTVEILNQTNLTINSQKTFYKDYLCSAEELGTTCARQSDTICSEGDVYWVDSCGNKENIYSSNKERSWNNGRVMEDNEVCAPNDGNNMDCGNCDYMLGSRCTEYEGLTGGPDSGDYYCQKTECVDRDGKERINGESWCVLDNDDDAVGARHFREICVNGEVKVEACADYKNEICIDGSIETSKGAFGTAACRVNRWQDCTGQTDRDDCLNQDQRDCKWINSVMGMIIGVNEGTSSYSNPTASSGKAFSNPTATGNVVAPITGNSVFGGSSSSDSEGSISGENGVCVPRYSPGLAFWEDGSAGSICGKASAKCVVVYEKKLWGDLECVENCECLDEGWARGANAICSALGDCGGQSNYNGISTNDGYEWKVDGSKKEF